MLARIFSGATIGLDGVLIEIEVDIASKGFPSFNLVGLPNKAIEESKDRVRTAISNVGFDMPDSRLTVNLAPADIPKEGASFDLPIALGILTAAGMIERKSVEHCFFIGELSLEGTIRPVPGILPLALLARDKKMQVMYVPIGNSLEASAVEGLTVIPVHDLEELVLHLNGQKIIPSTPPLSLASIRSTSTSDINFESIAGQEAAKRALEIAAAGFHNIHLKGVPGAGKTLLSRAFPSIMPELEREEILEVSKIYSIVGLLQGKGFITTRPFRSPHHTTSRIGLIGGSTHPAPGEISLAHRGVLFLDEFAEFPRSTLESLRQPLEDGQVCISRAAGSIVFPSRFLLIAASNPCPCGYLGHPTKRCSCSFHAIALYRKRLSGPILDRIDIHIVVPPVKQEKLTTYEKSESSESIRRRVCDARKKQIVRFGKVSTNAEMSSHQIRMFCKLTAPAESLLKTAITRLSLSARSYFKIIKIAQTISDLEDTNTIEGKHIAEALQYRPNEE
ncbi:MAG: YifB family Mg chelatase-like AAA ATPase [Microgenomates group bacterium]